MDRKDQIRFSRRAEVDKQARKIADEEIAKNRASMGVVAASQHAWTVAAEYQREQYEAIEREVDDEPDTEAGYGNSTWFKS